MTRRTATKIHRFGIFYFFIDSKCMVLKTKFVEEGVIQNGSQVMVWPGPQELPLKAEIIDLNDKNYCFIFVVYGCIFHLPFSVLYNLCYVRVSWILKLTRNKDILFLKRSEKSNNSRVHRGDAKLKALFLVNI